MNNASELLEFLRYAFGALSTGCTVLAILAAAQHREVPTEISGAATVFAGLTSIMHLINIEFGVGGRFSGVLALSWFVVALVWILVHTKIKYLARHDGGWPLCMVLKQLKSGSFYVAAFSMEGKEPNTHTDHKVQRGTTLRYLEADAHVYYTFQEYSPLGRKMGQVKLWRNNVHVRPRLNLFMMLKLHLSQQAWWKWLVAFVITTVLSITFGFAWGWPTGAAIFVGTIIVFNLRVSK